MNTPPTTLRAWKPRCLPSMSNTSRSSGRGSGFVQEVEHGIDERLEILLPFGQGGRPEDPVELGVGLAIIERKAELVLPGL